jgi:hypothetical protein
LYLSDKLDPEIKIALDLQNKVDEFNRHVQNRQRVSYIRRQAKNKQLLQVPEGFSMHFHHGDHYYSQQIKKRYKLTDLFPECSQTLEIRRIT